MSRSIHGIMIPDTKLGGAVTEFVRDTKTLRSIDTDLVIRGRVHLNSTDPHCCECGVMFFRRPRKQKPIDDRPLRSGQDVRLN